MWDGWTLNAHVVRISVIMRRPGGTWLRSLTAPSQRPHSALTAPSQRPHRDDTETTQRRHRDDTETAQRRHRDRMGIPQRPHRGPSPILPGIAKFAPKCVNSVESRTPQRHPPEFVRWSGKTEEGLGEEPAHSTPLPPPRCPPCQTLS